MLPPTPPQTPPLCSSPEDLLGCYLNGWLQITGILGVGAYGVVYTAQDVHTGCQYAVKALNKTGLDSRQRKFQQREIQLHIAASAHPNVVSVVKIMESSECTYVVMEYCEEGDLFTSITDRFFYAGNDQLVKSAILQIIDAVGYCHANGIYHRDLKPENILIANNGHTLKLADFGLATREYWTSDFGCGSTFYMSPECQATAPMSQMYYSSPANDVWSLGVILVNLACGRNPWKKASQDDPTFKAYLKDSHFLSTILPISHQLEHILHRIFEVDASKRVTLAELRHLVLNCESFTAQPKPLEPVAYKVSSVLQPQVLPCVPASHATETTLVNDVYSDSEVCMSDADSDYDSDTDSVFSSSSSSPIPSEASSPCSNPDEELMFAGICEPQAHWASLDYATTPSESAYTNTTAIYSQTNSPGPENNFGHSIPPHFYNVPSQSKLNCAQDLYHLSQEQRWQQPGYLFSNSHVGCY